MDVRLGKRLRSSRSKNKTDLRFALFFLLDSREALRVLEGWRQLTELLDSRNGEFMGVPQSISNYFLVCTGCDTLGSVWNVEGDSLPCARCALNAYVREP